MTNCSASSFMQRLDFYLNNILDPPCTLPIIPPPNTPYGLDHVTGYHVSKLMYSPSVSLCTRRAKLGQIQGGGVAESQPRFNKGGGGGCNNFILFTR